MSDEHIALTGYGAVTDQEMFDASAAMHDMLVTRRTIRDFSDKPVPKAVIETAIKAAATAPNGANQQPWHFAAISNPEMKRQIREAAEEEERAFYGGRASEEWLDALAPLGAGNGLRHPAAGRIAAVNQGGPWPRETIVQR